MLRSIKELNGYNLATGEGTFGKCKDTLFDDKNWTIRYLDIDTGSWLVGRRVLISPISLGRPDWETSSIPTILTNKQIEESPGLETDAPVSRQWEKRYYNYYGWPNYSMGGYVGGYSTFPPSEAQNSVIDNNQSKRKKKKQDAHLWSINEISGYKLETIDDTFGSVKDLVFEDETWTIRYLVVDTTNWMPSKSVLISPDWVERINFPDEKIKVNMSKEQIENSPAFDESWPINKEYEVRLYDFYGRPKYWENDRIHRNLE